MSLFTKNRRKIRKAQQKQREEQEKISQDRDEYFKEVIKHAKKIEPLPFGKRTQSG